MSGEFAMLPPDQQERRFETAAHAALKHWAMDGARLSLIKYRENAVYRVDHERGAFALRLHRPGYHDDDALRSEIRWMSALAHAGIDTPVQCPAVDGEPFVHGDVEGLDDPIQIDLFEWIEGVQLGSVEDGVADVDAVTQTYRCVGELAARVHNQAVTWDLPAGFVRHVWDADGLVGERPFWGRFWELEAANAEARQLLLKVRDRLREDLTQLSVDAAGYSLIHADLAPENVLVTDGVPRLIDFDDAGFGWHVFELVTALYFIVDEPYYPAARDALIAGYRSLRALSDSQLASWDLLMLARATTYVGWVHTRPETETARELTQPLLAGVCALADAYL